MKLIPWLTAHSGPSVSPPAWRLREGSTNDRKLPGLMAAGRACAAAETQLLPSLPPCAALPPLPPAVSASCCSISSVPTARSSPRAFSSWQGQMGHCLLSVDEWIKARAGSGRRAGGRHDAGACADNCTTQPCQPPPHQPPLSPRLRRRTVRNPGVGRAFASHRHACSPSGQRTNSATIGLVRAGRGERARRRGVFVRAGGGGGGGHGL